MQQRPQTFGSGRRLHTLKYAWGCLCLAALSACGGGGGGDSTGTLRLALTDAPACGFDAVNITIERILVHQSSAATSSDPGWHELVLSPPRKVDLLTLTNGVLLELGQMPLPAGHYTQLRLVLQTNDTTNPLANSVTPTGSTEVALKTPSGQPTGVKLPVTFDVGPDQMADLVLDFNACKSVVSAGASGQFLLKPVISAMPRYISGVSGYLQSGAGAWVSLQRNGEVIRATLPDATGHYLLQPVPPGLYTLVMSAPGRASAVVTQVPVATDLVTSMGTEAQAVNLPSSPTASVTVQAPAGTLARALQTVGSPADVIEVAAQGVDGVSGKYTFSLPTAAPLVAAYAQAPMPLNFIADVGAAGRYTAQARLEGAADKQLTLPPLSAGSNTTVTFTFP